MKGGVNVQIQPYSNEDYQEAKKQNLDLDNWEDYEKYFGLGEEDDYDSL